MHWNSQYTGTVSAQGQSVYRESKYTGTISALGQSVHGDSQYTGKVLTFPVYTGTISARGQSVHRGSQCTISQQSFVPQMNPSSPACRSIRGRHTCHLKHVCLDTSVHNRQELLHLAKILDTCNDSQYCLYIHRNEEAIMMTCRVIARAREV